MERLQIGILQKKDLVLDLFIATNNKLDKGKKNFEEKLLFYDLFALFAWPFTCPLVAL